MGQEEIQEEYVIEPTFLEALAIRNCIPLTWRRALSKDFKGSDSIAYCMTIDDQEFDLLNTTPKTWYRAMVKTNQQEIKRKQTWIKDLSQPDGEPQIDWEAVYTLPYKVTRETKIQSFHYRIAHRIITCNKYLCDIKVKQDPSCALCGGKDTLIHFFISCPNIKAFWRKLMDWCDSFLGVNLEFLSDCETILGMTNENGNPGTFKLINWLLLTAKFYIHRQRLFHKGETCLIAFLAEARRKLCVERIACQREGMPKKFKIWERMYKILNP